MAHIKKILIANRGEIACRIMRTCRDMGIAAVAVYSEPDAGARFVRLADESLCLGGMTSSESYLDFQKIIRAAKESGADAVHPGYGFLSENAASAEAVVKACLVFIGPRPDTIRKMGSKIQSKILMEKAGVPVIPGYQGKNQDVDHLVKEAQKIGLPCMVKASAGGGGKGLKRVYKKEELREAVESAKREAKSSFGDDMLLIEKYIESPRHIEIQIFGDTHGNIIHLFERECTLQRRHQKVIEETPSVALDDKLRKQIAEAAVKAAKTVDYVGAGTVEFVLGPDKKFYFLEMNTRLQVEHPITEMITGLDLVRLQIETAQGQKLKLKQKDVGMQGHAMEARVYAEDPGNQFLPVSGRIVRLDLDALPGVRYDMGVESGDEINVYYDPMIGKIIAHATDRNECIERLSHALQNAVILGTTTNSGFLVSLINHPEHIAGRFDTGFIDAKLGDLTKGGDPDDDACLIAAAVYFFEASHAVSDSPLLGTLAGFRISPVQRIQSTLYVDDKPRPFEYRSVDAAKKSFEFFMGKKIYQARLIHLTDGEIAVSVNEHQHHVKYALSRGTLYLKTAGGSSRITQSTDHDRLHSAENEGSLTAPLPGKVLKVMVQNKQTVNPGETLMIVEAMKMEHPIKAHFVGQVSAVHFRENDTVKLGDVLLEMTPL